MYKNSILIFIFLFSFQAINAQKIFYSEKLNDRFDFNRSNVIGKVKNNIIVLKYGESFKKAELLIYDYNMHFKGIVLNDLHYDIQLDKGVQIDDKSMVFPCNVKERLGFVRIEFD